MAVDVNLSHKLVTTSAAWSSSTWAWIQECGTEIKIWPTMCIEDFCLPEAANLLSFASSNFSLMHK